MYIRPLLRHTLPQRKGGKVIKIKAAVKEYLIEIEVRKYTLRTIKGYRTNLNLFLRFCTEQSMIEDVEDITLGAVKQLKKFLSGQRKGPRCKINRDRGSQEISKKYQCFFIFSRTIYDRSINTGGEVFE